MQFILDLADELLSSLLAPLERMEARARLIGIKVKQAKKPPMERRVLRNGLTHLFPEDADCLSDAGWKSVFDACNDAYLSTE